jgi:hypothetical protein
MKAERTEEEDGSASRSASIQDRNEAMANYERDELSDFECSFNEPPLGTTTMINRLRSYRASESGTGQSGNHLK